jgi:hypothetical protein
LINRDHYKNVAMFGEFGDRTPYDGYVPSRQYLTHAFKLYSASIKSHMDREVKNVVHSFCAGMSPTKRQKHCVSTRVMQSLRAW